MTDYWSPPDAHGPERRVCDTAEKMQHERGACDNDCPECQAEDDRTGPEIDENDFPQRMRTE